MYSKILAYSEDIGAVVPQDLSNFRFLNTLYHMCEVCY